MKPESPPLAGLMGGSCPHSAETAPQPHGFHGKIKKEGKGGSCKVLLGIPNHPPLAPTLTLPFIFKRASFLL